MRVLPAIIISIAFAFMTLLATPSFAQVSADGVAATLGPAMALASMCARPTAPIEAELEHYLQKVGAGPLETNRVRQAMMSAAAGWHGQYTQCSTADREIADTIANVRAATP